MTSKRSQVNRDKDHTLPISRALFFSEAEPRRNENGEGTEIKKNVRGLAEGEGRDKAERAIEARLGYATRRRRRDTLTALNDTRSMLTWKKRGPRISELTTKQVKPGDVR